MAVGFAWVKIIGPDRTIKVLKGYATIYDDACDEIRGHAKELKLSCLRYLDGAMNCLFNTDQCQDILNIEIPALRTKNLSKQAQDALDTLEFAIQDVNNPYALLLFEGD